MLTIWLTWTLTIFMILRRYFSEKPIDTGTLVLLLSSILITMFSIDQEKTLKFIVALEIHSSITMLFGLAYILKEADLSYNGLSTLFVKLMGLATFAVKMTGALPTVTAYKNWCVIKYGGVHYYSKKGSRLINHTITAYKSDGKEEDITGHQCCAYGFTPSDLSYSHIVITNCNSYNTMQIDSDSVLTQEVIKSVV